MPRPLYACFCSMKASLPRIWSDSGGSSLCREAPDGPSPLHSPGRSPRKRGTCPMPRTAACARGGPCWPAAAARWRRSRRPRPARPPRARRRRCRPARPTGGGTCARPPSPPRPRRLRCPRGPRGCGAAGRRRPSRGRAACARRRRCGTTGGDRAGARRRRRRRPARHSMPLRTQSRGTRALSHACAIRQAKGQAPSLQHARCSVS